MEATQAILRCAKTPLAGWGKKLLACKGNVNLAVAAIGRKLTVAVWYLMMGRWTPLEEIDDRLVIKVGKIISQVGPKALKQLGRTRKEIRQRTYHALKTGRVYYLDSNKTFISVQA